MLSFEILINQRSTENGLTTSSITPCEIACLQYVVSEDFMYLASLVVKWLPRNGTSALFTSAQSLEVLTRLRDQVLIQLESESTCYFPIDGYLQVWNFLNLIFA
jgi:hypothetical protein